jgi:hypothetical protein
MHLLRGDLSAPDPAAGQRGGCGPAPILAELAPCPASASGSNGALHGERRILSAVSPCGATQAVAANRFADAGACSRLSVRQRSMPPLVSGALRGRSLAGAERGGSWTNRHLRRESARIVSAGGEERGCGAKERYFITNNEENRVSAQGFGAFPAVSSRPLGGANRSRGTTSWPAGEEVNRPPRPPTRAQPGCRWSAVKQRGGFRGAFSLQVTRYWTIFTGS